MGIFSRSKEKGELVAIFHIGSSKVAGTLCEIKSFDIPQIIFSVAETIVLGDKLDTDRFFAQTLKALEVVANKMQTSARGVPGRVFAVLSSPWYASETRVLRMEKNTPFIFTEKLADELIKKEIKIFSEEHAKKYSDGGQAIRTIELKNIKTMLNGYETHEPLWKYAQTLEMTIFISMAGEAMLQKIESLIRKYFNLEPIKFSSFAISSFTVTRELDRKRENFLLVDIGGEITDIFMVKRGILRDSISFPLGRNFLVRGVAERLGSTLGEAVSLITLWKDGHAEEMVRVKIETVMQELMQEWLKKFQESLANLSSDISIPGFVYVTTEGDFGELFADIIKAEQFSQYTLAESKFEITTLNAQMFRNLIVLREDEVCYPAIIMDCIYINRFLIKM